MEPLTRTEAIIDFCLAPLALDTGTEAEREVRRRLTHVLRTYQSKTATPVAERAKIFHKYRDLVLKHRASLIDMAQAETALKRRRQGVLA